MTNHHNNMSELRLAVNLITAYVASKNMAGIEVSRSVQRFVSSAIEVEQQTAEVNKFIDNTVSNLIELGFKQVGPNSFKLNLPKQYTFGIQLLTTVNTVTVDAKISDR